MTSRSSAQPLVQVGDVVSVSEADYPYGLGPLRLRVTAVDPNAERFKALEWIRLRRVEIRWNRARGEYRDVLVRVSALRDRQPE